MPPARITAVVVLACAAGVFFPGLPGFSGSASAQSLQSIAPPVCSKVLPAATDPDAGVPQTPLYIAGPDTSFGSTGGQAMVSALSMALGDPFPLVYVNAPSCAALQAVVNSTAAGAAANYINAPGGILACTASGIVPDLAISDVYGDTCTPGLLNAGQLDVLGPVSVTTLAVPFASTESSISADAAYVVFGFGATAYAVKPWTDPNSIFEPEAASGPLMLVGAAIGLAPSKWGVPQVSLTSLAAETKAVSGGKANAAIGILPAPTAQANPTSLRVLAYEHTEQTCGYLPDSDAFHTDRINVRQGRYALWGPLHFVVNVDASGNPLDHTGQSSAELAALLNLLLATGPIPAGASDPTGVAASASAPVSPAIKEALMIAESGAGLVPWCAMQVTRAAEIGAEASFDPAEPCNCAFESSLGATLGTTRCATCVTDADCALFPGAPTCSYGYCEAP